MNTFSFNLYHFDMRLSLQKLLVFSSIGLSNLLVPANAQLQKPFQNHNALDVQTILKQHDKPNTWEAHEKHFRGETLAYVTPWNNRGKMSTSAHAIMLRQPDIRLWYCERIQGQIWLVRVFRRRYAAMTYACYSIVFLLYGTTFNAGMMRLQLTCHQCWMDTQEYKQSIYGIWYRWRTWCGSGCKVAHLFGMNYRYRSLIVSCYSGWKRSGMKLRVKAKFCLASSFEDGQGMIWDCLYLARQNLRRWQIDWSTKPGNSIQICRYERNGEIQSIFASKYNFDGIVIECGFPAFFQVFLNQLSTQLHKNDRQLIVVLPAIMTEEHRKYMTPDIFKAMAQYVDRFSVMTYDFSSHDP